MSSIALVLSTFTFILRWKEVKERKPKLHILNLTPPQDTIAKIVKGEFFAEKVIDGDINPEWKYIKGEDVFFKFMLTNKGGQPIQIMQMNYWILDSKNNRFYQIPLKHSLDVQLDDEKNKGYYGPWHEIINLPAYSSIEKRYLVSVTNGYSMYTHADKGNKRDSYLEIIIPTGERIFY